MRWAWALALSLGCGFDVTGKGEASGGDADGGTDAATSTTLGDSTTSGSSAGSTSAQATTNDATTAAVTSDATSATTPSTGEASVGTDTASTTDHGTSVSTGTTSDCQPQLAEVLSRIGAGDLTREWVRIRNPCPAPLDLTGFALGYGSGAFNGAFDLVGTIGVGECFVLGGPVSDGTNFSPMLDQVVTITPQLSSTGHAVALYEAAAATLDITSVPLDVVVYQANNAGFLDPTGATAPVSISGDVQDMSLLRTAPDTWEFGDPPTPNACPAF